MRPVDPFRVPVYVMDGLTPRQVGYLNESEASVLVDGGLVGAPPGSSWGAAFAFAFGVSLATHVAMHLLFRRSR